MNNHSCIAVFFTVILLALVGCKEVSEPSGVNGYKSFAAYVASRPTGVDTVNAYGILDGYYSVGFSSSENNYRKEDYYSMIVNSPDTDKGFYAYVLRSSEAGKKVFDVLQDGEYHKMSILVKLLDNNTLLIDDVLTVGEYYVGGSHGRE